MTALNKQALRKAAEKATPGDWRRASTRFNGITATPFSLGGEEVMLAGTSEKRDAEFIAAANPATVLALLDEIEKLEKASEARKQALLRAHKMFQRQRDRAVAAEKRIAELEARDKPKFVKCWSCKHDIEVLAIVDCDGYCPRCAAPIDLDDEPYAGIGVKGECKGGACE